MKASNHKISVLIVLFFISIGVLSSCNKMLELDIDGYILATDNYYKTPEQLETALRGVYSTTRETYVYANTMLGRMGLEADEAFPNFNTDKGTIAYYTVNTTDDKLLNHWRAIYKGINRANLLLANVENKEINITPEARNNVKGQALFLRGYYYFMLVSRFGGVPLVLTPSVSGKEEDVQIPKSSVKEVYTQVLADMEQAVDLVYEADKVESAGRVSKSAVWGILARVNLYMAGFPLKETDRYAEAVKWSEKVMTSGKHALNTSYSQVFINYAQDKYDMKESIFEVEFYGNGGGLYASTIGQVGVNNGIQYSATGTGGFGYSNGIVHPTKWLYNLYLTGDTRRDWAIAPFRYLNDLPSAWPVSSDIINRFCGKFRREKEILLPKTSVGTPQNFPLLRYADVLLMYAEAINEVNKNPSMAYNAINQVRRRAYGKPLDKADVQADLAQLSYDTFKAELKNERARELCFEALRKNDVVRWGDFYTNMKARLPDIPAGTATVNVSGKEYYTNVSERDVIWPLPSYEIGVNKRLVQNEDW